jgi:hypothetical protein
LSNSYQDRVVGGLQTVWVQRIVSQYRCSFQIVSME